MEVIWTAAGLDVWVFGLLLMASFAGSIISAALGLGGGILLLGLLASIVPPAAMIPLHGVVQLGSNGFRAWILRSHIRRPQMMGFLLGGLIGIAIGGMIVVDLPPAVLRIAIGVFILYSVFTKPPKFLERWPALTGAISSFLTMFVGATGPFVAIYVRSRKLSRHPHVATLAALMTYQHGLKVLMFSLLGFAFAPWAGVIVSMIAAGYAGTLVGTRILTASSDKLFGTALNILLAVIALRLIWLGLRGL